MVTLFSHMLMGRLSSYNTVKEICDMMNIELLHTGYVKCVWVRLWRAQSSAKTLFNFIISSGIFDNFADSSEN